MKVLITGASGFVGRHLISELLAHGFTDIFGISDHEAHFQDEKSGKDVFVKAIDIKDRNGLENYFRETQPDAIVHLAAVSHVVDAQNARESLSEINIVGTHNVCAAAAGLAKPVGFLFVSSSLVYGSVEGGGEYIYDELSLPHPESAYGTSKLAGEYIVRTYASENFKPYVVRPFNHIGPGQANNFVCPGLARKVAAAKDGNVIPTGNLGAYRDFTDVRDIVRAYRIILQKQPDETLFVLGSGKHTCIQTVMDKFIELSGKNLTTEVDQRLLRDVDPPKLCARPTRASQVLGWTAEYDIKQTLAEIYEYERGRL